MRRVRSASLSKYTAPDVYAKAGRRLPTAAGRIHGVAYAPSVFRDEGYEDQKFREAWVLTRSFWDTATIVGVYSSLVRAEMAKVEFLSSRDHKDEEAELTISSYLMDARPSL